MVCETPSVFWKRRLLRCRRCKFAAYCSASCQEEDWPRHRPECDLFASYLAWERGTGVVALPGAPTRVHGSHGGDGCLDELPSREGHRGREVFYPCGLELVAEECWKRAAVARLLHVLPRFRGVILVRHTVNDILQHGISDWTLPLNWAENSAALDLLDELLQRHEYVTSGLESFARKGDRGDQTLVGGWSVDLFRKKYNGERVAPFLTLFDVMGLCSYKTRAPQRRPLPGFDFESLGELWISEGWRLILPSLRRMGETGQSKECVAGMPVHNATKEEWDKCVVA